VILDFLLPFECLQLPRVNIVDQVKEEHVMSSRPAALVVRTHKQSLFAVLHSNAPSNSFHDEPNAAPMHIATGSETACSCTELNYISV